ncbi:hypothetical protein J2S44_008539 [Catenuloplanes niger]|uniref:Uncharacterized protein n=1 Tax=Catenuloplanes niger TaxID=587534 RepID=A0AAE4D0U5_9ACTN|nr:hypothetical protein [Catenuloplanes niger]
MTGSVYRRWRIALFATWAAIGVLTCAGLLLLPALLL